MATHRKKYDMTNILLATEFWSAKTILGALILSTVIVFCVVGSAFFLSINVKRDFPLHESRSFNARASMKYDTDTTSSVVVSISNVGDTSLQAIRETGIISGGKALTGKLVGTGEIPSHKTVELSYAINGVPKKDKSKTIFFQVRNLDGGYPQTIPSMVING